MSVKLYQEDLQVSSTKSFENKNNNNNDSNNNKIANIDYAVTETKRSIT